MSLESYQNRLAYQAAQKEILETNQKESRQLDHLLRGVVDNSDIPTKLRMMGLH